MDESLLQERRVRLSYDRERLFAFLVTLSDRQGVDKDIGTSWNPN